jgi:hypothetical protein
MFLLILPGLISLIIMNPWIDSANPPDLPALTRLPLAPSSMVVLLHGLARSASSMQKMNETLQQAGYRTCNIDYPSTKYPISTLVTDWILPQIERCRPPDIALLHFVTHSMGGILLRQLEKSPLPFQIGRVVMLSPPNHGSEVVDKLGDWWLFKKINGPAGQELGTAPSSRPQQLGAVSSEVGIITGDRSINWILSALIPGPDDGKVSLESAKVEGMRDYLVIHASHTFIMKNPQAIAQTLHFLQFGQFA